ncbi:phage tail protein [Dyadobacter sp. CY326]|uniref:phage tail protein n=1 Tax=Dyadobacter sp. CY326 TaxID=2907300 RepID=UPI001F318301|nr:tail fiber protein [Dyadobacter sp. CY326]MCE7065177.1 tail fiber protein [Dyadobacter sp. CY326]
MAEPFVAEIRIVPFNFAPQGWAWCDGQLFPISQNTALFSLLGTTYGGDGKSTFALPDLQGRSPMHPGQGPGLSEHSLGESGGSERVTLLEGEIPQHGHTIGLTPQPGEISDPSGHTIARSVGGAVFQPGSPNVNMSASSIGPAGDSQPHNNMQPYLTTYFCLALQGVFPMRP